MKAPALSATRNRLLWTFAGLCGVALVGSVDVLTGPDLALSLFYLIPIMLITWFAGRFAGLAIGVASATAWFLADDLGGQHYATPGMRFWNAAIRFGFFVVVTLLLSMLKHLRGERDLARLDALTGVHNRRSFFERAQAELERSRRYQHAFTLVYIDLDDFKRVNDNWGHVFGDELLCAIVQVIQHNVRKSDLLARLGGDEFALLLPEADQAAARAVVIKVRQALADEMKKQDSVVTCSMGALTCAGFYPPLDDLVNEADRLMYTVKKRGKDGAAFALVCDRKPLPEE